MSHLVCVAFALFASSLALGSEILERPLIKFHSIPSAPKVGEKISIFAKIETSFENQEIVPEGFMKRLVQ